jgi:phosphoribosylformylglycinamidine cyclo-ligase
MRLDRPFVYDVTFVPEPQPVFRTIADAAGLDAGEAYATFNMGIGFAVYVAPGDADRCIDIAAGTGHTAWIGGAVRQDGDRKEVRIAPLGIAYGGETLCIRGA